MAMDQVHAYLAQSRDVVQKAMDDPEFIKVTLNIVDRVSDALAQGRKLLLAGNGGSAADAQHIAGEFLSRLNYDRPPTAAIALTTDTSVLTAIGNDYGFAGVFERQVRGLGRAGDVFIGLSTSGKSENVLAALRAARELGLATIGFTGASGGDMRGLCDFICAAPSDDTALVQQVHLVAAHVVCLLVEQNLFGATQARPEMAAAGTRAP
jgi:D-sedoheptulose 7-phosphate isomerase